MFSLNICAKIVYESCFKLNKKDTVLIVFDKEKEELVMPFFEEAKILAKKVTLLKIPIAKNHGEEPSANVAEQFLKYDVILFLTTKSLSHTIARKNACDSGARIASMPGITHDMIERTFPVGYPKMKILTEKIGAVLKTGKLVSVKSPSGTKLEFSIDKRNPLDDFGDLSKKGSFDNLPSGETFIAPVEASVNGIIVVDASMSGIGKLERPINIKIKNGRAVSITGGAQAKKLQEMLSSIKDPWAFQVAEFGIGTNEKAIITGLVLEDEKVFGTCHFALGNNITFGGKSKAKIHLDGVINSPTILVDGKIIMDKGKLMI